MSHDPVPPSVEVDSTATNPGGLSLDDEKLRRLEPAMFGVRRILRAILGALLIVDVLALIDRRAIRDHLANGDARAAVVVSTSPLNVACFSDDLDCVAMLRFPNSFVGQYGLQVGTRLTTVNQYFAQLTNQSDLVFGPHQVADYSGFFPLVAEFLSSDEDRMRYLQGRIQEAEWARCRGLGESYLRERPGTARLGRPRRAGEAAGFMTKVIAGVAVGVVGITLFIVLAWKFL